MFSRQGVTLLEIIIVLIIIGVALSFGLSSFVIPNEKSMAANAQYNLVSMHASQENYNNNNGTYCVDAVPSSPPTCAISGDNCAGNLADINCNLLMNIPDDGKYTYSCAGTQCTATRVSKPTTNIVLTLNTPIKDGINPVCNTLDNWCP